MIMNKANTGCLPVNLQNMFHMSIERIPDTRNSRNVSQVFARTTKKANCITVLGIQLWDTIQDRGRIVAEWLRAWDTLTMFEATVCGRP